MAYKKIDPEIYKPYLTDEQLASVERHRKELSPLGELGEGNADAEALMYVPSDPLARSAILQANAYKEQTKLAQEEINRKREEQAVERRRIDEKQIRSLRRNRSARGFLGSAAPATPAKQGLSPLDESGMSDKLGG